jgi:hypothetical protein
VGGRLVKERHLRETPLRLIKGEASLRLIKGETPIRPIKEETPLRLATKRIWKDLAKN